MAGWNAPFCSIRTCDKPKTEAFIRTAKQSGKELLLTLREAVYLLRR
jgi:hypothetical protein